MLGIIFSSFSCMTDSVQEKATGKSSRHFSPPLDSLKCLTRKTVASTLHLSLQLKLIYRRCQQGRGWLCGHLTPASPGCTDQQSHKELVLGRKPRLQKPFFSPPSFSFFGFGSFTFQEKRPSTSNQSNTQKSTCHMPNRTS